MKNSTINISMPQALLDAADKQAESELRNRSELIREAIRDYLVSKSSKDHNAFTNIEIGRIDDLENFTEISANSHLLLSGVYRQQPNNIPDLFQGSESDIVKLIENPPSFRRGGWDLRTLDRAKPVAGEFLQVVNGNRKVLRVYRDAQVIMAADNTFIGHAVNKEESETFNINGLAIAEVITNFAHFLFELAKFLEREPNEIIARIALKNPKSDRLALIGITPRNPFHDRLGDEVNSGLLSREIVIPYKKGDSFDKYAYKILAEFFYFFGVTNDRFYYVDKEKNIVNTKFFEDK